MSATPQCKCPNNEVVVSSAGGKDFWYCRGCKSEVVLEPETNRDEGPISIWGQTIYPPFVNTAATGRIATAAVSHAWNIVGCCIVCGIYAGPLAKVTPCTAPHYVNQGSPTAAVHIPHPWGGNSCDVCGISSWGAGFFPSCPPGKPPTQTSSTPKIAFKVAFPDTRPREEISEAISHMLDLYRREEDNRIYQDLVQRLDTYPFDEDAGREESADDSADE